MCVIRVLNARNWSMSVYYIIYINVCACVCACMYVGAG